MQKNQRCKICELYQSDAVRKYGICKFIIPALPSSLLVLPKNRGMMTADGDGKTCVVFEEKK